MINYGRRREGFGFVFSRRCSALLPLICYSSAIIAQGGEEGAGRGGGCGEGRGFGEGKGVRGDKEHAGRGCGEGRSFGEGKGVQGVEGVQS